MVLEPAVETLDGRLRVLELGVLGSGLILSLISTAYLVSQTDRTARFLQSLRRRQRSEGLHSLQSRRSDAEAQGLQRVIYSLPFIWQHIIFYHFDIIITCPAAA